MLKKVFGCALITELQLILLMGVDFNATNKILHGQQMLDVARKYKLMPEEIYSEKNCFADDGTLVNKITATGAYMRHRFSWASFTLNYFSNFCPFATFDSSKCS
jgi:hypothetical protein